MRPEVARPRRWGAREDAERVATRSRPARDAGTERPTPRPRADRCPGGGGRRAPLPRVGWGETSGGKTVDPPLPCAGFRRVPPLLSAAILSRALGPCVPPVSPRLPRSVPGRCAGGASRREALPLGPRVRAPYGSCLDLTSTLDLSKTPGVLTSKAPVLHCKNREERLFEKSPRT